MRAALLFGLASLAGDARQRAASSLRAVAWRLRLVSFVRYADRLDDLSGKVAGCGCIDDDAEPCARGGEWCECSCHGRRS